MRCPDCQKDAGNHAFCPYCGATIGNHSEIEVTTPTSFETRIHKSSKSLISAGITAFGIAAICIILCFLITLFFCEFMMGELAGDSLAYTFKSKVSAILVMGVVTALALSFTNNVPFLTVKLKQIAITIIFALISFAVVASVGNDINNVPNISVPYHAQCARTLNLSMGTGMPLLVGSIFMIAAEGEKRKAIRNTVMVSVLYLVLAIALVYFFIAVLFFGLTSIAFAAIASIVVFVLSIFMN